MQVKSELRMAAEVLVTCPYCLVAGPKNKFEEHVATDHQTFPSSGPIGSFGVGVPERFRPVLHDLQQQTGFTYGALVAIALEDHYAKILKHRDMRGRHQ